MPRFEFGTVAPTASCHFSRVIVGNRRCSWVTTLFVIWPDYATNEFLVRVGTMCPNTFTGVKLLAAFQCLVCDVSVKDGDVQFTWLCVGIRSEIVHCDAAGLAAQFCRWLPIGWYFCKSCLADILYCCIGSMCAWKILVCLCANSCEALCVCIVGYLGTSVVTTNANSHKYPAYRLRCKIGMYCIVRKPCGCWCMVLLELCRN